LKNLLYRNAGNGTFTRITDGAIASDTGFFLSCTWVDYDNDGWLDLFVTADASSGGKNRLYHNEDGINFTKVTQGSLVNDVANHGGCTWGDYDNDGFLDVFVPNGTVYGQQRNGLYHNNTNTNSWLKLKCVGTTSNRSAIGTKVRAKATIAGQERWQTRQIVGSEGWVSFNALDVVIGLGDAVNIDLLRIEWPSGLVQDFKNVPVKQTFKLTEGEPLDSGAPALNVSRTAIGIHITWDRDEYDLQSTTDLTSSDWQVIGNGSERSYDSPISSRRFFRLKHR
jgi:enediyne biosynthesis protein E4